MDTGAERALELIGEAREQNAKVLAGLAEVSDGLDSQEGHLLELNDGIEKDSENMKALEIEVRQLEEMVNRPSRGIVARIAGYIKGE